MQLLMLEQVTIVGGPFERWCGFICSADVSAPRQLRCACVLYVCACLHDIAGSLIDELTRCHFDGGFMQMFPKHVLEHMVLHPPGQPASASPDISRLANSHSNVTIMFMDIIGEALR